MDLRQTLVYLNYYKKGIRQFTISRHCSLTNILRAIISFRKSSEAPFFLKSYQITLRGAQSKNFPGLQKHNTSFLPIDWHISVNFLKTNTTSNVFLHDTKPYRILSVFTVFIGLSSKMFLYILSKSSSNFIPLRKFLFRESPF